MVIAVTEVNVHVALSSFSFALGVVEEPSFFGQFLASASAAFNFASVQAFNFVTVAASTAILLYSVHRVSFCASVSPEAACFVSPEASAAGFLSPEASAAGFLSPEAPM